MAEQPPPPPPTPQSSRTDRRKRAESRITQIEKTCGKGSMRWRRHAAGRVAGSDRIDQSRRGMDRRHSRGRSRSLRAGVERQNTWRHDVAQCAAHRRPAAYSTGHAARREYGEAGRGIENLLVSQLNGRKPRDWILVRSGAVDVRRDDSSRLVPRRKIEGNGPTRCRLQRAS